MKPGYNRDTKGTTCHDVCVIYVSILSGLSEKWLQTHFIDIKTKAGKEKEGYRNSDCSKKPKK